MRILVVDDDPALRTGVSALFEAAQFDVQSAATAEAADDWVRATPFAAIVLDLGLPDGYGLDLVRRWRHQRLAMPILVLSARGTPDERADGLDAGANDYLAKPFHSRELVARVRRLIQGSTPVVQPVLLGEAGQISFDLQDETVSLNQQLVALSTTLRRVLGVLVAANGRPVSKTYLMDQVRELDDSASENAVEQWVRRLRAKLGTDLIRTVPGQGYSVCIYHAR